MAQRAYWEQTNRHGEVDRIELHDSEYGGASPELQFKGDATGFTRQWDEITSESNDKLINIQANRIQIGKYDFRPRIENQTGFDILEDIRDSDNKRFHIVHKIDGTFEWAGWVTTRIFSYPEKDNNFFAHIRATDFEILKGQDHPLSDNRQTFITTFADLFSELPEDTPIKTATSWVEENVTARVGNESYDFLDEIRHETKALRDFGRTGDETDQPITKWEALEHVAEPGLLIRQMGGHVMIDQLTDLADPTAVNETVYDSTGTVTTATQSVDRTQTGYTTADNGTPSIKNVSQNDTYPAIKRAKNKYDHRTSVSTIQFPDQVTLDETAGSEQSFSQAIISDGGQSLNFSANIWADITENEVNGRVQWTIQAAGYYWNEEDREWQPTGSFNGTNETSLTFIGPGANTTGASLWQGSIDINTTHLPNDADGTITITLRRALSDSNWALETRWEDTAFSINNAIASENSESINYQLTQDSFEAPEIITLDDTWFGDLPTGYSPGALRHGTGAGDLTTETWRRRGQTIDYRNYHWNLLAEVIDMGRTNMRKLEADIWGAYDPTKVLDYNGSYFYFAGGKYDGTRGRWRVTLMELNLQTGSDTFDDIPKFTDESGSGSGSTSSGGGGGLDQSTADARYVQEQGDSMSGNLDMSGNDLQNVENFTGNAIGSDLQAHSSVLDNVADNNATADLDLNSLAINGDDLFSLFYTESEIDSFFDLYYSKADLTDGDEDLHLNSLELESGKFLSPTSYQFRNAGDTGFRDVEAGDIWAGKDSDINPGITDTTTFDDAGGFLVGDAGFILDNNNTALNIVSRNAIKFFTDEINGAIEAISISDNGNFTANQRFSASNGSFIAHENGWVYNEIAGQNVVYNTDSSTRNVWEIKRGSVGDTGDTNRLWAFDVLSDDSIRWQPYGASEKAIFDSNLYVEGGLFAKEFVVDQTRVMYNYSMTPEGGKIASVSGSAPNEVITFEDEAGNEFVPVSEGSILRIQERTGLSSGVIVKAIWRKVESISGNDVTLSDTGISYDSSSDVGSIGVGDYAVQRGHTDTPSLDGRIDFEVSGVDQPYISIWDGVDDIDGGFEAMRMGWTGSGDATHEFSSRIAGDSGIMGATESDGAVFWITEDEAQIGAFSFNDLYLTDGNTYIGKDLLNQLGSSRVGKTLIGEFNSNAPNAVRVQGDEIGTWAWMRGVTNTSDDFFRIQVDDNAIVQVSADEANFFGIDVDSTGLFTGDGSIGSYTAGTVTGLQPRGGSDLTRVFFGGADDKNGTNASFYATANGELFYEAMGSSISAKILEASFGNNQAPSLTDNEWYAETTSIGDNDTNADITPLRGRYKHKFGINEITLNAQARETLTVDSGNYANTARIYIRVLDQEGGSILEETFTEISGSTYNTFTLTLDVSDTGADLTSGTYYVIEVDAWAQVTSESGANDAQDSATARTYLREDYYIDTSTG